MISYPEVVREDRRLQILLILTESPKYSASHYLVQHVLDGYAHSVSSDQLKGDLAWLTEQGLIECETFQDATVVKLTNRGLDAAQGRIEHPGVKRPRPE
jgi:Fe2+ or Zn2+ uptake regulation protein